MFLHVLFIVAGFMLLIKGADYLIDGSSAIARKLGVSSLVIGLTVVAFGTSTPELVINLLSAASGSTDLAFGNVIGSNIANILLILGMSAFFARIPVNSQTVLKEILFMVLSAFVLIVLAADVFFVGTASGELSRSDGVILLTFFVIFLYYMWLTIRSAAAGAKVKREKQPIWLSAGFTCMGLAGLVVGGYLAVEGSVGFARALGVSETLIGLTIVAVGTSLPELVSSVVAARKGETDIAIGNIVGSNVFNGLLILGITASIAPVPISSASLVDAAVALLAAVFLFVSIFNYTRDDQGHWESPDLKRSNGITFILLYAAYIVYIVIRG